MNKRYTFMNILRIMALCVIIGYHFLADIYQRGLCEIQHPDAHMVIGNINLVMVSVGIFFMLSGCGLVLMMRRRESVADLPDLTEGRFSCKGDDLTEGRFSCKEKSVKENSEKAKAEKAKADPATAGSKPSCLAEWKAYYAGRFFKILIPFYITYIAYLIFKLISSEGPLFTGVAWWKAIFTVMGIDEYLHMAGMANYSLGIGEWFLGAIIMMYAVFPLIYTAMKKWKWQTIAVATAYYVLVVLTYQSDIAWYNNVFVKIYDFVLGMFLAFEFDDLARMGKARYSATILPTLAVVVIAFAAIRISPAFSNIIVCAGIFLIGFFLEVAIGDLPAIGKLFAMLCSYEYYVFLVHHCVIYLYQEPMQKARMIISKPKMVALFGIEIATMILLAIAIKWISERFKPLWPGQKKQ